MSLNFTAYNPEKTPVHRIDARVKVVLVILYSLTLFMVGSWFGLGLCFVVLATALLAARVRVIKCARQLFPLAIILCFTLLANSFSFDLNAQTSLHGVGAVSAGILEGAKPFVISGAFGFLPDGFMRGLFYVLRIVFLVYASLVLVITTSSSELSAAISRFLAPLSRFGLPVHDVSTSVSIALRFIPVTIDEFNSVRNAQLSRGANFDSGGLLGRLKMWGSVLIPMFVGLFRRADRLATAMDARCYGMGPASRLNEAKMSAVSYAVLFCGIAFCLAMAVFF